MRPPPAWCCLAMTLAMNGVAIVDSAIVRESALSGKGNAMNFDNPTAPHTAPDVAQTGLASGSRLEFLLWQQRTRFKTVTSRYRSKGRTA